MDDALGADVHPASGCHLAVGGAAHGRCLCPGLRIIALAHHKAVGDDHSGGLLMGVEKAQGMAGHHHKGLLVGEDLQIFFQELVLHPVLAYLSGLAVGHKLIRIKGHIMV